MRILKGLLIGFAIFIGILFLGFFFAIALYIAIMFAIVPGPVEHSHATALSAVLAGILEATVLNPYFYAALSASLLVGYMLAKPRNTTKHTP